MAKSAPRSYRLRRRNSWFKLIAFILALAIIGLGVAAYTLRREHPISVRAVR
jgi:hypothetical protein